MEVKNKYEESDKKNHLSCGLVTGHDYEVVERFPANGTCRAKCKRCHKEFIGPLSDTVNKKARLSCVLFLKHSYRAVKKDFKTGRCTLRCWRCGEEIEGPIDQVFMHQN